MFSQRSLPPGSGIAGQHFAQAAEQSATSFYQGTGRPCALPAGAPARTAAAWEDFLWVAGFYAGVMASRLVEPTGPENPLLLGGHRLPGVCVFRAVTGRRCPSCGMTRGVLYMFRLEPLNAMRANPFAPVAFLLAARG